MGSGAGRLEASPAVVDWEFSSEEYRRRLEGARRRMVQRGMSCLFLTSEKNIRYLTGYHSQTWASPTRPRYVLLPVQNDPVAIVPTTNVPGFRATTWIDDIRAWQAPCPDDDGVSLVIDALRTLVAPGGRIGVEIGPEMRVQMPISDYLRVQHAMKGAEFVDLGPILRPLRLAKSPEEVARIRHIAQLVSEGFARLPEQLRAGQTEAEVYAHLHRILVELGAEKVPYLVPVAGPSGYEQINMGPSDRRMRDGDVLFIDVGATWRGYFCDFDRNFAIGTATPVVREAYGRVFEATQAGIAAVRPGRTCAEVWRDMSAVLAPSGKADTPVGRMGHGIGLDMTEPPSLSETDETVLEAGMVLAVEPSLVLSGTPRRLMVHEENVVVTQDGCELLTRRAPAELPVV